MINLCISYVNILLMAYIENKNIKKSNESNSSDSFDYLSKDLLKFFFSSAICFLFMILIIIFT